MQDEMFAAHIFIIHKQIIFKQTERVQETDDGIVSFQYTQSLLRSKIVFKEQNLVLE